MKTCFVSRFGGFGDVLHASHLPRLIKEHYEVNILDWETSYQGYQILQNNPYIDNLIFVDTKTGMADNRIVRNWEYCKEKYDLFFNLINTIEHEYCVNENTSKYYRSTEYRRKNFGNISYYDVMTKACDLPEKYLGTRGELYYDPADQKKAKEWADKKREQYSHLILINLSGSSLHKKFSQARTVCSKLHDKYPKSLLILTGDEYCKDEVFEQEGVMSWVGKMNFRSVALMTRYLDLTISMETGLPLVAHAMGSPCLQLLTAASPENHCLGAKNAYWLQSPVSCSPCHKNPKSYWGCPRKDDMPECVWFDVDVIVNKAEEILNGSLVPCGSN